MEPRPRGKSIFDFEKSGVPHYRSVEDEPDEDVAGGYVADNEEDPQFEEWLNSRPFWED